MRVKKRGKRSQTQRARRLREKILCNNEEPNNVQSSDKNFQELPELFELNPNPAEAIFFTGERLVDISSYTEQCRELGKHDALCTMGYYKLIEEVRHEATSNFHYFCNACEKTLIITSHPPTLKTEVNENLVEGTSIGIGYSQIAEMDEKSVLNVTDDLFEIKEDPLEVSFCDMTEQCNTVSIKQEPEVVSSFKTSQETFKDKLKLNFRLKIHKKTVNNDISQENEPSSEEQSEFGVKNGSENRSESGVNNENVFERTSDFQKCKTARDILKEKPNSNLSDRKLKCTDCNQTFAHKERLKVHMKEHGKILYACNKCNEIFYGSYQLRKHKNLTHPNTNNRCHLCAKTFRHKVDLSAHLNQHVRRRSHKCNTCAKSYYSAKSLQKHRITHYTCEVCEKPFNCIDLLNKHMKNCHFVPEFECTECNQPFYYKNSFIQHINLHRKIVHECNKCEQTFPKLNELEEHKNLIHRPKFPCNLCDETFYSILKLTRHLKQHAGNKPYKCDLCNRSFQSEKSLKNHRICLSNRMYPCDRCEKKFNSNYLLKRHQKIHVKPEFKCTECGHTFYYERTFIRHQTQHKKKCTCI